VASSPADVPKRRYGVSATPVVLPKWGLTMLDATLVEWLKQEGERVEVDDAICLVETDKVDAEVTAPVAGVLGPLLVQKDDVVSVGAKLTTIREDAA
jgi:2-oxoglutarate dehydrogenase E2 component (dihydrolipoamide succinyltransferase)